MITPSTILLVAGMLVLVSVLASKISDRFSVPALIVFLAVGMLAGSDGPGGIEFDNPWAANFVGTVALAFILFSGGLSTNWRIVRPVLWRGFVLSTLGVIITAGLVGLCAWAILGFGIGTGLLIGAIISSTDAAAVFSILRSRGVGLKGNLKPLLELESGSNDPTAIFLTIGMTRILTEPDFAWPYLFPMFFWNMCSGAAVGLLVGKTACSLFDRIRLDNKGLYPVLSVSLVALTFSAAEQIGGNGFLAVYLSGIMMNGSDFAHKRSVSKYHDGLAWLMQIVMFVVLGLLVFPSHLPGIAFAAIGVVLILTLVARPVSAAISLWGSSFPWRQRALVAWTGLRGAVPIVLATFPLTAGYAGSDTVFNVVFFSVLTSILVQGTLLMPVARWLRVDEPLASPPTFSLEIERTGHSQGETREIEILPNMAAAGRTVSDLRIPPNVLILLIGRGNDFVVPRGRTRIEPYDTLLMFGKQEDLHAAVDIVLAPRPLVRQMFLPEDPLAALPMSTEEKYLSKQVVVIGYGIVGKRICDTLAKRNVPFVVADRDRAIVAQLRAQNVPAVFGDASIDIVLAQAHVARAALLIIATSETLKMRQMIETALQLNPRLQVIAWVQSQAEADLLEKALPVKAFLAENELADGITRHVLSQMREQ